jgi:outer membrane protein TolC
MLTTCTLLLWTITLSPVTARAQEQARAPSETTGLRVLTLEQAIRLAHERQPTLQVARSRVAAQEAAAKVPRAQWLPVFGVTAQLFGATANNTTGTYVGPGGFLDIPRIGGTRVVSSGEMKPYASTLAAAGVNQELYDFGRIGREAAALDALVDVERQRQNATLLELTFEVENAYFAVLAAKAILKASDDAFGRSQAHRDLAQAGVRAGLRSPIELTRAEADLARFDTGRIRARAGLEKARISLSAVVGYDDVALDAADVPYTPPDMPDLQTAIAEAGARDPAILAVLADLRSEELRTRAIAASLRPDLGLTATVSARAGGAPPSGNGVAADHGGWLPEVPNWDVGVVLSWPIFDGTVDARESAGRAREQVRRDEVTRVRHEHLAGIRFAYAAVDEARRTVPGLERSVEAARANYDQAEARFRSGLGTSIELADAEAVRTDSEIQLALGHFEVARARSSFGRAIAERL